MLRIVKRNLVIASQLLRVVLESNGRLFGGCWKFPHTGADIFHIQHRNEVVRADMIGLQCNVMCASGPEQSAYETSAECMIFFSFYLQQSLFHRLWCASQSASKIYATAFWHLTEWTRRCFMLVSWQELPDSPQHIHIYEFELWERGYVCNNNKSKKKKNIPKDQILSMAITTPWTVNVLLLLSRWCFLWVSAIAKMNCIIIFAWNQNGCSLKIQRLFMDILFMFFPPSIHAQHVSRWMCRVKS